VLGVDEFARRRGHTYATVLVDVETRRPVDILPERSADTFDAWLAARPGTQVICRDRAGCYSDGASRGAPQAIQVADRWHLLHNLGDAVEKAVARHRQHLPAALAAITPPKPPATEPAAPASPALTEPAALATWCGDRMAVRTRSRHAEVHTMLADGRSARVIAAELGLSRNTVRRFARAAEPEELLVHDGTGRRPTQP
jgi:Transposase